MSECHDGASKAPQDRAKTYARFTRVRNGANEELRIGAEAYNGFDYVSIRLWTPGMDGSGELYPSRMSATIRRNELMQTIGALQAIARDFGLLPPDEPPADTWRGYGGDGGPSRPKPSTPAAGTVPASQSQTWTVDHAALYAGQGRRRVELSQALKDSAFDALVQKHLED